LQAEVSSNETANANTAPIKSDQHQIEAAREVEAAEAKASSVDFVT
jgi:hypothetical protein